MMTFSFLLCVNTLSLVSVEASFSSSSGGSQNYNYDLSGQGLRNLYNSRVHEAEWLRRPLRNFPAVIGDISHSGVRVTLADGSQWLIHKGDKFGLSSQTVVTDARHMSSDWELKSSIDLMGTKTVADLVNAGGSEYNICKDNCHDAATRMMED